MNENFLRNIEDIVESLGYECVHVSLRSDFGRLKLQILIDTLGGINAGDCELVSGKVSGYLDEASDIPELDKGRYYLEVSSPGIERPLYKPEDYARFQGREARLRLSDPIGGRKTFTGTIQRSAEGTVTIICDGQETDIPFSSIRGGNLVYRFNDDKDKGKRNKRGKK
ncbi:MAG: ribosome maturation factor RimP [Synergistaceae bacterium]|nr:ribosome maturation factor RimP [Synergistaceae bacterium]MBQ6972818.1 ribosome maturation factor RimP [Synergistaceae bacterium]